MTILTMVTITEYHCGYNNHRVTVVTITESNTLAHVQHAYKQSVSLYKKISLQPFIASRLHTFSCDTQIDGYSDSQVVRYTQR